MFAQFYDSGVSRKRKRVVDEEQKKKFLDYKQYDQLQALNKIVQLIAIGLLIAVINLLIISLT